MDTWTEPTSRLTLPQNELCTFKAHRSQQLYFAPHNSPTFPTLPLPPPHTTIGINRFRGLEAAAEACCVSPSPQCFLKAEWHWVYHYPSSWLGFRTMKRWLKFHLENSVSSWMTCNPPHKRYRQDDQKLAILGFIVKDQPRQALNKTEHKRK